MVTGKYGGILPKAQNGKKVDLNPFAGAPEPFYQGSMYPISNTPSVKRVDPSVMVLSVDEVMKAAKDGKVPRNATPLDIQRIKKINPEVSTWDYNVEKWKDPKEFAKLSKDTQKAVYHDLTPTERKGLKVPYTGYWDRAAHENFFMRNSDSFSDRPYVPDPAMEKGLYGLNPFSELYKDKGIEHLTGPVNSLFDVSRNEINNLITGKYAGVGDIKAEMDPTMTNKERIAYNMMDPFIFKALVRSVGLAAAKKMLPGMLADAAKTGIPVAETIGRRIGKYTPEIIQQELKMPYEAGKFAYKGAKKLAKYIPNLKNAVEPIILSGSRLMQEQGTPENIAAQNNFTLNPALADEWDQAAANFRPYRDPSSTMPHTILPMTGTPEQLQTAEDSTRRVVIKSMPQDTTKKPKRDPFFDTF
jgi:hypothetical protein